MLSPKYIKDMLCIQSLSLFHFLSLLSCSWSVCHVKFFSQYECDKHKHIFQTKNKKGDGMEEESESKNEPKQFFTWNDPLEFRQQEQFQTYQIFIHISYSIKMCALNVTCS